MDCVNECKTITRTPWLGSLLRIRGPYSTVLTLSGKTTSAPRPPFFKDRARAEKVTSSVLTITLISYILTMNSSVLNISVSLDIFLSCTFSCVDRSLTCLRIQQTGTNMRGVEQGDLDEFRRRMGQLQCQPRPPNKSKSSFYEGPPQRPGSVRGRFLKVWGAGPEGRTGGGGRGRGSRRGRGET